MTIYNALYVVWDAPEELLGSLLPRHVDNIEADDQDEVATVLSDEFGWSVVSLDVEEADTRPDPMSLEKERMEDRLCEEHSA